MINRKSSNETSSPWGGVLIIAIVDVFQGRKQGQRRAFNDLSRKPALLSQDKVLISASGCL